VGEVAAGFDPDGELRGLVVVVEDRQLFVEAVRHRAMADHRQLGVDIDRAGSGHEEKACLEVLQVIDRQGRNALPIDGEHPAGEKARVEPEQPRRVGEGGLDVAALIAHHKGVAIKDLDLVFGHGEPSAPRTAGRSRGGPGKIRWMANSSSTSPVHTSAPRSTAAIAFSSPRHSRSNSARSAWIVHSAGPPWCDTTVSPLSTATSHRSVVPAPSTRSKRTRP